MISEVTSSKYKDEIILHKSCYSSFTNQTDINRIETKKSRTKSNVSKDESSSKSGADTSKSLRSNVNPTNWNACLFCQDNDSKTKLSSVSTFKMTVQIITHSHFDYELNVKLSGIGDLIAQEAKYHASCYMKFIRKTSKIKDNTNQPEFAMISLCVEIRNSAKKGYVFEMPEIWKRYCELATEKETTIPKSYFSRKATFKDKLAEYVSDV